jgi:hypothetical protein
MSKKIFRKLQIELFFLFCRLQKIGLKRTSQFRTCLALYKINYRSHFQISLNLNCLSNSTLHLHHFFYVLCVFVLHSFFTCVWVCLCVYVGLFISMCFCVFVCWFVCVFVYMCGSMCICVSMCLCASMCLCVLNSYIHSYVYL